MHIYFIHNIYFVIYELHKINIRLFVPPVELNKNLTAEKSAFDIFIY